MADEHYSGVIESIESNADDFLSEPKYINKPTYHLAYERLQAQINNRTFRSWHKRLLKADMVQFMTSLWTLIREEMCVARTNHLLYFLTDLFYGDYAGEGSGDSGDSGEEDSGSYYYSCRGPCFTGPPELPDSNILMAGNYDGGNLVTRAWAAFSLDSANMGLIFNGGLRKVDAVVLKINPKAALTAVDPTYVRIKAILDSASLVSPCTGSPTQAQYAAFFDSLEFEAADANFNISSSDFTDAYRNYAVAGVISDLTDYASTHSYDPMTIQLNFNARDESEVNEIFGFRSMAASGCPDAGNQVLLTVDYSDLDDSNANSVDLIPVYIGSALKATVDA